MQLTALTRMITRLLRHYDVPVTHARIVARAIADAEARGITSHGVRRLPNYVERLRAGAINPRPQFHWQTTHRATAQLDANHAFGQVATYYAAQRVIRMTRRYGIAAVGIHHCEHVGALDTTVRMLVAAQLATLMLVNTPAAMAPLGGTVAILGSNPIGIGIPGISEPLMIFDSATTTVSRGSIVAAARHGTPIPADWALDADGRATSDATMALAGALRPAGRLGYGVGLAIALLTGAMIGGTSDDHLPSFLQAPHHAVPTSVLLIGIDPNAFGGLHQLHAVGAPLLSRIRHSHGQPRIPGDARQQRILAPDVKAVIDALMPA
jgi:(2R)-3-sulfolactate dehydrogenase (NADP+)